MATTRGILRSLMYQALEVGYSFNAFYRSAMEKGISYRRSDMLSDWANIRNEITNLVNLRKLTAGDIPEHTSIGKTEFAYTQPFVYKARVEFQVSATAPLQTQFVTVLSDKAMRMGEVTGQVLSKWGGWGYGKSERITTVEVVAAMYVPQ